MELLSGGTTQYAPKQAKPSGTHSCNPRVLVTMLVLTIESEYGKYCLPQGISKRWMTKMDDKQNGQCGWTVFLQVREEALGNSLCIRFSTLQIQMILRSTLYFILSEPIKEVSLGYWSLCNRVIPSSVTACFYQNFKPLL